MPATFKVSPDDPAPMLTLSIVPLTSVVAAVLPEVAPAYCALRVYWPGGACEPLL